MTSSKYTRVYTHTVYAVYCVCFCRYCCCCCWMLYVDKCAVLCTRLSFGSILSFFFLYWFFFFFFFYYTYSFSFVWAFIHSRLVGVEYEKSFCEWGISSQSSYSSRMCISMKWNCSYCMNEKSTRTVKKSFSMATDWKQHIFGRFVSNWNIHFVSRVWVFVKFAFTNESYA